MENLKTVADFLEKSFSIVGHKPRIEVSETEIEIDGGLYITPCVLTEEIEAITGKEKKKVNGWSVELSYATYDREDPDSVDIEIGETSSLQTLVEMVMITWLKNEIKILFDTEGVKEVLEE